MELLAVSLGLVPAIGWGVADFFSAKVSKQFGGVRAAFCSEVLLGLIYSTLYVLFLRTDVTLSPEPLIYAAIGAVAFACAIVSFFKGLEIGPVSIVSPLGSLYPLVATVILVGLFALPLSPIHAVGILLVIGGAVAAAGLFNHKKGERLIGPGPLFGLAAALCWGIGLAMAAQAVGQIGWQLTTLIQVTLSPLTLALLLPFIKGKEPILHRSTLRIFSNKFLIGTSTLQLIAVVSMNFGLATLPDLGPVIVAISACYPILTIALSLHHFKEKIQAIPLAGAIVGVIGVIVLSFG